MIVDSKPQLISASRPRRHVVFLDKPDETREGTWSRLFQSVPINFYLIRRIFTIKTNHNQAVLTQEAIPVEGGAWELHSHFSPTLTLQQPTHSLAAWPAR